MSAGGERDSLCRANEDEVEPVSFERPSCSAEAARMINARSEAACDGRHTRRERVALGVFAALLVVGAVALFSYINAGHGLNVAATSIDDVAGDMTGYGVILFEGTATPDSQETGQEEGGVQGIISGIFGAGDDEDDASSGASGASGAGLSSSSSGASPSTAQSAGTARSKATKPKAVSLNEAEEEYREKGASVITVDADDLDAYAAGRIVMMGGRTYGIFSLTDEDLAGLRHHSATTTRVTTTTTEDSAGARTTNTTTRVRSAYTSVSEMFEAIEKSDIDPDTLERIDGILDHFEDCGVDTVVALTPDPSPFKYVEGVDVVVTFKQSDRFLMSETIDGTMYFDAPEVGQVGVLMVAPGNVVSSKVMSGE